MTEKPEETLAAYEGRLEEEAVALEEAAFDRYYRHSDVDVGAFEKRYREILLEPGAAAACEGVRGDKAAGADATRRAAILADWITDARMMTDEILALKDELEKVVIMTKPSLDGKEIARHEKTTILMKNGDRDLRRRAYLGEGALRVALAEPGRRLYRLRNDAARALGYADYPSLALGLEGLTVDELLAIFDRYEQETRAPYREMMAEGVERFGLGRLEPWDAAFIPEQLNAASDKHFPREGGMTTLKAVVKGFGRDLDAMGIQIHADADIPYGGLCFAIRIPDDIRILLSLKDGMGDYRVLYHEFGHAFHRKLMTATPFTLKVGEAGFFNEAMAEVWGLWVDRPAWLAAYTKMSAAEIEHTDKAAARSFAARIRKFMAHQVYEIAAYRNADGDFDAMLNDAARRYLDYQYEAGTWQEVYFPYLYPMYNKNYMLARVIQRAVHKRMEKEFGEPLGKPAAFDFLVDNFYADGAARTWREKLAAVGVTI